MSTKNIAITKSFSVLHYNIRSLAPNLSHLTDQLNTLDVRFSVIGITETWLGDSSHMVDIDGIYVHKHRPTMSGGGVRLYVSSHLNFKL